MELLHIKSREKKSNHDAAKERKKGLVPGILYGKSVENTLIEIKAEELQKNINRNGEHGILEINFNGKNHRTLIKEIQKDSVNQKIIHIDLEELAEDTRLTSEVPLVFIGEKRLKEKGGILQKSKSSVKVRCGNKQLPNNINVDVTNMDFGDCIRVSNVEFAKEITVLEELDSIIASLTTASGANTSDANDLDI